MGKTDIELARKRMHKAKMLSIVCAGCDEVEDCTCEFGLKLLKQVSSQCASCNNCLTHVCSMNELIKEDHLEDQLVYCQKKRGDNLPFILRPEVEPFFCF